MIFPSRNDFKLFFNIKKRFDYHFEIKYKITFLIDSLPLQIEANSLIESVNFVLEEIVLELMVVVPPVLLILLVLLLELELPPVLL
jgi:hypothetical protein